MPKKTALKIMIGLLLTILIFHLSILLEIIPYEAVWAGKLNSVEEMYVFETISILINVLLLIVLRVKFKNIKTSKSNKIIDVIIWAFVFLFALNTLGNLFAKSLIEQILGTVLTAVSAILCWIIVRKNNKQNPASLNSE
ncbi:MAG: hypothetical protein COA58_03770 [Bacteroidetes bacterium]|nr:MAG: hypothetical protein COA58_03770 [Bacteroidota bacterium]